MHEPLADPPRQSNAAPAPPSPQPQPPDAAAASKLRAARGSAGLARSKWLSVAAAAVGALCAAFIGGVVLKALLPSPATSYPLASFGQSPELRVRQYEINTPPPVQTEKPRGWEVYFPHGRATLSADQQQWLARLSKLLGECAVLRLNLTGLVSSAKFPPPSSDEKNITLAHARAEFVRQFVAERVPHATLERFTWQDYAALDTRRYFRDIRRDERVEHAAEFLNRRVDIELARESQCPFMIQTLATPLADKPLQAVPAPAQ